ncbi:hypothetical protein F4779DRAFT_506592 [Xylariaceae sp. FL0662B]|nr:hypothetical protein F4779DRAFT_506592 [Xylariaceae sp. FL0662B]
MALPFTASPRRGNAWFCVGLASSFPNITDSGSVSLSGHSDSCDGKSLEAGCKVFYVPATDSSQARQVEGDSILWPENGLRDQVLVFKYKGTIHAIDNRCPHSAYPLSEGAVPFDIEDFGVVFSAGLTCPKHGWSFDLFTGIADRSNYKMRSWEVQLRPRTGEQDVATDGDDSEKDKEVWVRRKQRIG